MIPYSTDSVHLFVMYLGASEFSNQGIGLAASDGVGWERETNALHVRAAAANRQTTEGSKLHCR